jgi:MinD-like ATPase involved in chromosome partitioning or flagellar assembly
MSTGVLVAVAGVDFEAALLEALDGPRSHVVRRCVDVPDLLTVAASHQARVALVSAQLRALDRTVVARLREEGIAVVGATAEAASADEAALRRLGIELFASADDMTLLSDVIAAAVSGAAEAPANGFGELPTGSADGSPVGHLHTSRGSVIAVWGGAGAPGRSVLALGLSAELARLRMATMLVDADVYGGASAALLGLLDESSGLLAAARAANSGTLDVSTLARQARTVSPQLRVLTGLPRADRWTELRPALLRDVLEVARALCAYTVADCGFALETDEEISYDLAAPRRNGATLEALQSADRVVVVGAADPLSLGRLIRAVHELSVVVPDVSPYVVVNQVRHTLGWSEAEIAGTVSRATGVPVARSLPYDRQACDKAVMHGRTLPEVAPESRLTKALRSMAAELAGVPEPAGTGRRSAGR